MEKLRPYLRIIRVSKKPGKKEFQAILKVTGLGVILIGLVGYVVFMASQFLIK